VAQRLTVGEAAATYVAAMRNVLPGGPGVCATCHTFIDERYAMCGPCATEEQWLDAVVPITYSVHHEQMHTVLRRYKDGTPSEQRFMKARLAAILWRFLERHEACVAATARVQGFDFVTTVPSSTAGRDEVSNFRTLVGWCEPVETRLERLLKPTGRVTGREFHPERYLPTRELSGEDVLLLDDTWVRGGHAQSAVHVLKASCSS
jgi:hypothetical protein